MRFFLNRFVGKRQAPTRRPARVGVEGLESKALLATTSTAAIASGFIAPLSAYVQHTAKYELSIQLNIQKLGHALQSQITSKALVALQAGTLIPADFQTSVNNIANSFQTNVDQQLLPGKKTLDAILDGQAQAIQQTIAALNTQLNDGLIDAAAYNSEAGQAVNAITGGPLYPLNTTTAGFATATKALEVQLNLLPPSLATGATPSLTLAQVQQVANADTTAYSVAMNAALFKRPKIAIQMNEAINTFDISVAAITTTGSTTPAQQLTAAITALDNTLLDKHGLFGPNGRLAK